MTLDEITTALKSSDAAPSAALSAGVAKAEELAPLVFATADKLHRGIYLLPEESALLFYGLHILAAARHPELFDHVVMLAELPAEELNQIFPDSIPTTLARLLLSVWNNDADVLFEVRVLGRDDPLAQQRVDLVVADDDAALGRELTDELGLR